MYFYFGPSTVLDFLSKIKIEYSAFSPEVHHLAVQSVSSKSLMGTQLKFVIGLPSRVSKPITGLVVEKVYKNCHSNDNFYAIFKNWFFNWSTNFLWILIRSTVILFLSENPCTQSTGIVQQCLISFLSGDICPHIWGLCILLFHFFVSLPVKNYLQGMLKK